MKHTFSISFVTILFKIIFVSSKDSCGCDFTPQSCDLLCCCDLDCSDVDKAVFKCRDNVGAVSKKYCIPGTTFFKSNTPYIIKEIENLVCIEKENEEIFPQSSPKYEISEQQLSDLVNQINPEKFESNLNGFDQTREYFTVADPLWTITQNNQLSPLFIPYQKLNGKLSSTGFPVNYLVNKKSTIRYPSDDSNWITSNVDLNRFTNFKIIPKPNSLKECQLVLGKPENEINFYTECENLVPINILISDSNGNELCAPGACQIDTLPAQDKNAINIIQYNFEYLNPNGVQAANLNIQVFRPAPVVPKADSNFKQLVIEVSFVKDILNPVESLKLSGNPGYINGEPIVAGFWNTSYLDIPVDRDVRFTSMGSSLQCRSDLDSRVPIRFRINMAAECTYSINYDTGTPLQTLCNNLQQSLAALLLGDPELVTRPNRVASFGNLIESKNNTDDFVEIAYLEPNPIIISDSVSTCFEISNQLSIEIAYANVGNEYNKQAKIVKVNYNWNNTVNFNFRCLGQTCIDKIPVSTRVTFVDVSLPPTKTEQKLFRVNPVIPEDFFAPF